MLFDLHKVGGYMVIFANAAAGLFALAAWRWPRLRGRAVWIATIAAEVLLMVQVILGVLVMNVDDIDPPKIHTFYGFVAFVTIGLLYSYRYVWKARGWLELAYGLGGLFLMGLAIRAVLQVTG